MYLYIVAWGAYDGPPQIEYFHCHTRYDEHDEETVLRIAAQIVASRGQIPRVMALEDIREHTPQVLRLNLDCPDDIRLCRYERNEWLIERLEV